MEPARHLEVLLIEGRRLAAVDPDALDLPVPAVPGWTVERVVRHTGKVHQWVAASLDAGPGADLESISSDLPGIPKGPDCLPAYRDALEAVHAALADRSPEEPAGTFVGAGTVAFWCRRQAHEVTVHRIDAADALHARGGPEPDPVAEDCAVDGIDEWARVFLATRWNQRFGPFPEPIVGRSVHIHGSTSGDGGPAPTMPPEWLLSFGDGTVEVASAHAKGDVAMRGPVEHLLLALWRRRPLESLDLVGDRRVAEDLYELARF